MRFTSRLLMVMVLALVACPDSGIAGGEGGRDPVNPFIGGDTEYEDEILPPPWKEDPEGWKKLTRAEKDRRFGEWLDSQRRLTDLPPDIEAHVIMQGGL